MKTKPTHLVNTIHNSISYDAQFCDGRAIGRFYGTSDFTAVTCKRCLKKMAANPLPSTRA